ncbi:Chaperone protein DnaK 1 [Clarias magur]|uniref:Chaperone protein DnaK 1 n=1 Tax=Clarias magur TaxID=1594786 RepID=A0A8J4UDF3_CLAMG|nr:Chaperone protein DnaK 1 [Clarias magur]
MTLVYLLHGCHGPAPHCSSEREGNVVPSEGCCGSAKSSKLRRLVKQLRVAVGGSDKAETQIVCWHRH